ncbi:MAG TPA: hypothetical protein VMH35_00705 [Streptosporangiaceae bacterium]|nr:hypothetical protein [Streptosporangiaceae bacterium]
MEQSRQQTTAGAHGAGGARSTDCAHLHSAFGPGCPHCWTAAAATTPPPGAQQAPVPSDEQAAAA